MNEQKVTCLEAPFFAQVTNKDLNTNLKIICEICETGISISFYIARHTFATTVALLQGVPIQSIKEMMGMKKFKVPCFTQKQIILYWKGYDVSAG
jgi:site-specific recombinase XerD